MRFTFPARKGFFGASRMAMPAANSPASTCNGTTWRRSRERICALSDSSACGGTSRGSGSMSGSSRCEPTGRVLGDNVKWIRAEPVYSGRAAASGAEAGGGVVALVAVEEGVGAGGSAARPPVSCPELARARSWRVVGLGRRVARGGRERTTKPSPTVTNTSARTTVPESERRVRSLAVLASGVETRGAGCAMDRRAVLPRLV